MFLERYAAHAQDVGHYQQYCSARALWSDRQPRRSDGGRRCGPACEGRSHRKARTSGMRPDLTSSTWWWWSPEHFDLGLEMV